MTTKFKLLILLLGITSGIFVNMNSKTKHIKKGMIKMAIYYPNEEGVTFDMDYYSTKHMPMAASLYGELLKGMEIDKGLRGATPEMPSPYIAVGYFYFENMEAFQQASREHSATIRADIPNYTNIRPKIQLSEVITSK